MTAREDSLPTFRRWKTQMVASLKKTSVRTSMLQFALILLLALTFISQGGISALNTFVSPLVLGFVFGGTALFTAMRAGASQTQSTPVVRIARDGAVIMGILGSLAGALLLLWEMNVIADVTEVPSRLATALSSLFVGLFLSEIILSPYDESIEDGQSGGRRVRWLSAGLTGIVVLIVLFMLSNLFRKDLCTDGSNAMSISLEHGISFVRERSSLSGEAQHRLELLVPTLKNLKHSSDLVLSGEVPVDAECCSLAQKRLYSIADFLKARDVNVLVSTDINRFRQSSAGEAFKLSEFPRIKIGIHARRN